MPFCARELLSCLHHDLESHIDTCAPSWSIDSSPLEAACYRLKESLVKKLNQADRPSASAEAAALEKFKRINLRCGTWGMSEVNYVWEEELMTEFKNEVYRFYFKDGIDPIFSDYNQLFLLGRTGPGASIGASGTDLYSKLFSSPLSATHRLPDIWEACYRRNPQFLDAFCFRGEEPTYQVVDCNKLSFVNKTAEVARSICTEPSINMWMQLGMGSLIESRLRERYGIDLSFQPEINRRLARLGSILDDVVTIDLESASDSMSLRMLQWCLPTSFMQVLLRLRSPQSRLPDGSLVELEMVSTMGNGFTFPLQTAIFSAAVVATFRFLGISQFDPVTHERVWSVFGDDIIVPSEVSRHLIRLIELLGFSVNRDKTFVEGPFRESCGTDWFLGVDVRPFYLRRLRTLQDAFVAVNGLNLWSSKTGIFLHRTVGYITGLFPAVFRHPVPPDEDDAAGLHLPRELLTKRQATPLRRGFGLLSYTAYVPLPVFYRISLDDERVIGRKKRKWNPFGLYIAFLHGTVRDYRITVRQDRVRYITKRRITPRWGFLPSQKLSFVTDRYTRFLNACASNLGLLAGL